MPERTNEPLVCDVNGCDRLADYAYIGESGDLYMCEFHGGAGDVEGWVRITSEAGDPPFDPTAVVSVVTEHAQHWDADAERFYWAKRLAAYTEWEREGWVEDLRTKRHA